MLLVHDKCFRARVRTFIAHSSRAGDAVPAGTQRLHMQTKSTRYNVVGSGILHLLMHNAVAAVSVWRCCVNTKSSIFLPRFSAQSPLSQNSYLYCFSCYFLCSIWNWILKFEWTPAHMWTNFNDFVWTHENSAVIFSCRHRVNYRYIDREYD